MKTRYLMLLIGLICVLFACNNSPIQIGTIQKDDCETRPAWNGYDSECGCFGLPFGFSGWCVPAKGGEITYFGKTNFHHIQDSLCLIYDPSNDDLYIINVSKTGYRARSIGSTVKKAIDRKWNLIYEFLYSDIKDPSDDLQKSESKIIIDPNKFDPNLDELRYKAYKYRTGVPGKVILDSIEIIFVKELNRK